MDEINNIIKNLYEAYVKKDISLMKELIQKWKSIDPNNAYLKKYETLCEKLENENWQENNNNQKVLQIWWKSIKCNSCWSNIWKTPENIQALEELKTWKSTINLKCNYCNASFQYINKTLKPLYLNISIWKEITLDNKKYSITWWVRYVWTWWTRNSWKLEYIERILVDNAWDIYYLSESKAHWSEGWESWIEYQTELSRKIIPEFNLWEITDNYININWDLKAITEFWEVEVKEVFWENTKSYTIWEKIDTYQLNYNWKNFVFEKEKTKDQQEIWVYHTWEINDSELKSWINTNNIKSNIWWYLVAFIMLVFIFWLWIKTIIILAIFVVLYFILKEKAEKWLLLKSFFWWYVVFLISSWIYSWISNWEKTDLNKLVNQELSQTKWYYKIVINPSNKQVVKTWTTTYDNWWVKTTNTYLDGLNFKISSQKDIDLLKKINSWEFQINSESIPDYKVDFSNWTSFSDFFKNWNIFKLK